jgi:hypothetical protein
MEPSKKAETKASSKLCPFGALTFTSEGGCGPRCEWFDEESQHCVVWKMLWSFRNVNISIESLIDLLRDINE